MVEKPYSSLVKAVVLVFPLNANDASAILLVTTCSYNNSMNRNE